jgi:hypothetical protein
MLIKQIFTFHSLNIYPENLSFYRRDLNYMISKGISQSQSAQSARLSIQAAELGPPARSPARECCSPHLGTGGETDSLAGEGVGGPNADDGTDTLVLYRYNPST